MPKQKLFVNQEGLDARILLRPVGEELEDGEIDDDEENNIDTNDISEGEKKVSEQKEQEPCLSLSKIQQFLLALVLPEPRLSTPPTWCRVVRCGRASRVGIFLLDNQDIDWIEDPGSKFPNVFRFETSPDWIDKLIDVPMSRRQQEMAQIEAEVEHKDFERNLNARHKVPKTSLLLSPVQMVLESYPMPTDPDIVMLPSKYKPATDYSPIFALDCEMCLTTGNVSELTRISIVDEEMRVVYNQLVKPVGEITNYLTKYSGITRSMMTNVKTTLDEVHEFLRECLPRDTILCGHSLNNDLKALKIFHPYVIDTSVIYNKSGRRVYKPSLKSLAYEYLNKDIQTSNKLGHNSLEDAISAMELLKLKLVNGSTFGDTIAYGDKLGVRYDAKTGATVLQFDKFVERQEYEVLFREMSMEGGKRFLYVHDDQSGPTLDDDLKSNVEKLLEDPASICVVLTSNGRCYVKI